jgi:hypothetical protein
MAIKPVSSCFAPDGCGCGCRAIFPPTGFAKSDPIIFLLKFTNPIGTDAGVKFYLTDMVADTIFHPTLFHHGSGF